MCFIIDSSLSYIVLLFYVKCIIVVSDSFPLNHFYVGVSSLYVFISIIYRFHMLYHFGWVGLWFYVYLEMGVKLFIKYYIIKKKMTNSDVM